MNFRFRRHKRGTTVRECSFFCRRRIACVSIFTFIFLTRFFRNKNHEHDKRISRGSFDTVAFFSRFQRPGGLAGQYVVSFPPFKMDGPWYSLRHDQDIGFATGSYAFWKVPAADFFLFVLCRAGIFLGPASPQNRP